MHDEPDSDLDEGPPTSQTAVTVGYRASQASYSTNVNNDRLAIAAVLNDGAVPVTSRSFSPHVSVMQSTDAWQGHHLGVR